MKIKGEKMEKPTLYDLIDLLTMSLEEISSIADNLGEVLFNNKGNDSEIYKSAYAIKTMILDLEKKSVDLTKTIIETDRKPN